jgi:hypothetical protein
VCPTLQLSHSDVVGVGLGRVLEVGGPESFPSKRRVALNSAGNLNKEFQVTAAAPQMRNLHLASWPATSRLSGRVSWVRCRRHYENLHLQNGGQVVSSGFSVWQPAAEFAPLLNVSRGTMHMGASMSVNMKTCIVGGHSVSIHWVTGYGIL